MNGIGIGKVYTPIDWASWLIERTGAFELWVNGASVCDPTFGDGAFIKAFILLAKQRGLAIDQSMISRLHGFEIDPQGKRDLLRYAEQHLGILLDEANFATLDILSPAASKQFDVLVGNPPWVNFSDLPSTLRRIWGDLYIDYGLVSSRKDVLLGGSRADLSTLILKKVLDKNLNKGGLAVFFIPLSILFNDGSNDKFRPFPGSKHNYSIEHLWDFADERIFENVATRYGSIQIRLTNNQSWPVPTDVFVAGSWERFYSVPSDGRQGFWQRQSSATDDGVCAPLVEALEHQKPRQGVNTCGANKIFIFRRIGKSFINSDGLSVALEDELMLPLLGKAMFRVQGEVVPERYILVAHNPVTGKPFGLKELEQFPLASAYLSSHRQALMSRKGLMIGAHIKRGLWWSLLGVGPYSFAPWKVAWEALGRSAFEPRIVRGLWQGNQAQHAFCACHTEDEAKRLAHSLSKPAVQNFLAASAMGGTMNWAQPGRVAKLFAFDRAQSSFAL